MERKNKKNERVFHVHNIMRDHSNRTVRATTPVKWGRVVFIGKGQTRISSNRHIDVTMSWLLANLLEVRKNVTANKIKVTDPDGAVVDVFTEGFPSGKLTPKQPDKAPEKNSIADESPGPQMILSRDKTYIKEGQNLPGITRNVTTDVPDLLKDLEKKEQLDAPPSERPTPTTPVDVVEPLGDEPADIDIVIDRDAVLTEVLKETMKEEAPTVTEGKTVPPAEKQEEAKTAEATAEVAAAAKKVFRGRGGVKASEDK